MTWYAWAIVAVYVAAALATVNSIGQPRRPMTPGIAAAVLLVNGLIVWGVVSLASA